MLGSQCRPNRIMDRLALRNQSPGAGRGCTLTCRKGPVRFGARHRLHCGTAHGSGRDSAFCHRRAHFESYPSFTSRLGRSSERRLSSPATLEPKFEHHNPQQHPENGETKADLKKCSGILLLHGPHLGPNVSTLDGGMHLRDVLQSIGSQLPQLVALLAFAFEGFDSRVRHAR